MSNFRTFPGFRISHYALSQVQVANLGETGELPAYAWPGGYPLYYVTHEGSVLCPEHASHESEYSDELITAVDVNWEDPELYCEHGERIPSAYAEPEEPAEDLAANPYI